MAVGNRSKLHLGYVYILNRIFVKTACFVVCFATLLISFVFKYGWLFPVSRLLAAIVLPWNIVLCIHCWLWLCKTVQTYATVKILFPFCYSRGKHYIVAQFFYFSILVPLMCIACLCCFDLTRECLQLSMEIREETYTMW